MAKSCYVVFKVKQGSAVKHAVRQYAWLGGMEMESRTGKVQQKGVWALELDFSFGGQHYSRAESTSAHSICDAKFNSKDEAVSMALMQGALRGYDVYYADPFMMRVGKKDGVKFPAFIPAFLYDEQLQRLEKIG